MFDTGRHGSLGFYQKLRLVVRALAWLRRPALPLARARDRYDAMLDTLAKEFATEFTIEWEVDREAELDRGKRRSAYTTRVLRTRHRVPAELASADSFEPILRRVVDMAEPPKGFRASADLGSPRWPRDAPPPGFGIDPGAEEIASISILVLRDRHGGDVEAEVDDGVARLSITATVTDVRD